MDIKADSPGESDRYPCVLQSTKRSAYIQGYVRDLFPCQRANKPTSCYCEKKRVSRLVGMHARKNGDRWPVRERDIMHLNQFAPPLPPPRDKNTGAGFPQQRRYQPQRRLYLRLAWHPGWLVHCLASRPLLRAEECRRVMLICVSSLTPPPPRSTTCCDFFFSAAWRCTNLAGSIFSARGGGSGIHILSVKLESNPRDVFYQKCRVTYC